MGERLSISADTIVDMDDKEEFAAPDWVGDFVHGIDEYHADEPGDEFGDFDYREEPVTVYECLQVVEEIVIRT